MTKCLITGATGFVGSNLINYFSFKSNIEITKLSLRGKKDIGNLKEANVIIHLASKVHDVKNVSDPEEYYQVNYELTKKLYDGFLSSEASKFIFISSVKATADAIVGILDEYDEPNPQTHYGKSKLIAEKYIENQPLPKGKSYYILRPCMIHGPGNKGNLNLLYKFIKKGIPYPLAGFSNKRSFLSVENLCFVINELIARNDIASGVYNVADDETLSTNEVVSILAFSLNKRPKLWAISPAIIIFFSKISDLLHLPFTIERLNKLTESYVVSNQKIKKAINKEFPLTAVEGLKITANSFNKD